MEKPGRKRLKDKKEPLTIYVRKSLIKKYGGRAECRMNLTSYAECGFPQFVSNEH